jgi:hypothetical protein
MGERGCEGIAEWGCVFVQGGKLGGFRGESFVESSQLFLVEAHLPKRETDVIHTITFAHLIHLRFFKDRGTYKSDRHGCITSNENKGFWMVGSISQSNWNQVLDQMLTDGPPNIETKNPCRLLKYSYT